jgi:Bacterial Ig-like domain
MIRTLTTTAKSAGIKLPLTLLGVIAVVLGVVAATSLGAPAVSAPTIGSKPAGRTSEISATFTFSGGGSGVTYQCSLDGAAFAACASPKSYSGLATGSHTFQVRARRSTGEVGSPASYTWVIDRTPPPAPAITSKPAALSDDAVARFAFSDSEAGATFLCRVDARPWSTCSSPEWYLLADGSHTFQVQARDAAGNASAATSYTWTIDTQPPPAPRLTATPSDPTTATTATFAFTDGEPGVHYQCELDDDWAPCTSPRTYSGLDTGRHSFSVRALDAAGNASRATSFSWTITRPSNRDFSISGNASALLYPGAPARPIALTLTNPNPVAIYVTSVQVAVTASTVAACSPATNLALTQSSASSAAPVRVPAGGSVTLPAQGATAPTIRMVNLPVNQDACKNARFTLSYSGSAHS